LQPAQPRDADSARHHDPDVAVDVLRELQADHLNGGHLLVEELDDAPQLARDAVGHKDQTNAAGTEIGFDRAPERLDGIAIHVPVDLLRICCKP